MLRWGRLQITGFDQVEHGEPWHKNMELFKHFTDVSQGVRRSGAAAIDMCHVACGTALMFQSILISQSSARLSEQGTGLPSHEHVTRRQPGCPSAEQIPEPARACCMGQNLRAQHSCTQRSSSCMGMGMPL